MSPKQSRFTQEQKQEAIESLIAASKSWSDPISRHNAPGPYSKKYLANLDSIGKGPEGAFKIGKYQMYPKKNYLKFLIDRVGV